MFGQGKHPGSPDFSAIKKNMESIPVQNHEVEIKKTDDGEIYIIDVQLKYSGLHKKLATLLKLKKVRRFQLDGISLEIYHLMDGRKTIEGLVDYLYDTYNLSFFESRGLVLHYVHLLTERGIIVVAGVEG